MTLLASSAAATPLYRVYQTTFGLSQLTVTMIFASYVFSVLAALLVVGSLSDFVGRKPVILAALILNIIALFVFMRADLAAALILARVIQGLAVGSATTIASGRRSSTRIDRTHPC